MNVPTITVEQARQDVQAKAQALADAELALENTRGCSIWVHSRFTPGCKRCEAFRAADNAVIDAESALDAARARLDAVESQQRSAA